MVRLKRVKLTKPAAAALCACVALPGGMLVGRAVAARVARQNELSRILDRAERVCGSAVPPLASARLVATPLVAYRRDGLKRLWSVEISNSSGEYVGDTVWDAERGDLVSSVWQVPSAGKAEAGLDRREAGQVALMRLLQMNVPVPAGGWRVTRKAVRAGRAWTVWCGSSVARFRLKLDDASGRLLSAERRT